MTRLARNEWTRVAALCIATDRPDPIDDKLVAKGLVMRGDGRYGAYTSVTKAGRELFMAQPIERRIELEAACIEAQIAPTTQRLGQDLSKKLSRGSRAASTEVVAAEKGDRLFTAGGAVVHSTSPPLCDGAAAPPATSQSPRSRGAVDRLPSGPVSFPKRAASDPRRQRKASGTGSIQPAPSASITPPTRPLKAGATTFSASSPPPPRRQQQRSEQDRQLPTPARREAVKSANEGRASGPTPNAVRVVTGAKATYYPLSMWDQLHGTKQRVTTSNKFYRSYPVATSTADDRVFP